MERNTTIAMVALTAIAPIVWGSTYIVTTEWLPENSPLFASAMRALPAGLLLIAFTHSFPKGLWWLRIALLGILNIGLFFYCLFFAATHLSGGMAAMVMSVQPVIVTLLSWYFLNHSVTARQWIASLIGILGISLLVLNSTQSVDLVGILVALIGTLSMATGVVLTKKWGRPAGMTLLGFTGWQLFFGGVVLLPIALLVEGIPAQITAINYVGYTYLSLVGAILGYALWFRGIEKLPPITVSFLGFLSSVSACLLGYVVLNQTLTFIQLLGTAFILGSILLVATQSTTSQSSRPKTGLRFTETLKGH
ncbi:EamA family transporter [Vibrio profundi]|uniref:EamA family transporter n=1 Tax=Vibrio profundi TaxID=1774960 RepID=UPI0037361CA3